MIRTVVVRIVCLFELTVVQCRVSAVLFQQFFVSYYSQQEMKGHGKNTMLESVF